MKLYHSDILTSSLDLLYSPTPQPAFLASAKLARLLELGADYLNAIAPSADHPAKQQATLVKSLLDAGILGTPLAVALPSPATADYDQRLSSAVNPPWQMTTEPSYALLATNQHHHHQQHQQHPAGTSGGGTPAVDLALNRLVDLSEFGDGFWEFNNASSEMHESGNNHHWSFKL